MPHGLTGVGAEAHRGPLRRLLAPQLDITIIIIMFMFIILYYCYYH